VLTIGCLDPLGVGGVAADLRALAALRVHGAAALAAVGGEPLPVARIEAQLRQAFDALHVAAVKTGALGTPAVVEAVAAALTARALPLVVDPALAGRDGAPAAGPETVEAYRTCLLPLATVATPNMAEAALLAGSARAATLGQMRAQGEAIAALGPAHVVVSGGHGRAESATDILVSRDGGAVEMRAARLDSGGLAGLSATFAAAIAAHVARGEATLPAIQYAKLFVTGAIGAAGAYDTGPGPRAVNAFHRLWMAPPSHGEG
jgi:hydroxymethylpyrimidine/phosphomethylpyrimidine kinase